MTKPVRMEPDGTVLVASGKVELGQGIRTALAQIAADELGLPLESIRMLPPSTAYSPDEGVTSGSLSIQEGGNTIRVACKELHLQSEKHFVGASVPRLDLPAKIAGRPSFLHDMTLPGMLHARIVRPSHAFSRLVSLPKLELKGQVVRDGNFVGVLAEREEDAIAGAAKLKVKAVWVPGPEAPGDIHAWLKKNVTQRNVAKSQPDEEAAARAVKRISAAYTKPYIAHASIGPSCAIARMSNGKLEVWSHTQGIFNLRRDLAMILHMPEQDIVVTHADGAGCYGHNGADDVALEAALFARAFPGRPVRLQWMREDEFAWEPYGAAMSFELEAGLDAQGTIVSWRHELWSNGHTHRPGRATQPTLVAAAHIADALELGAPVNPPLPAGGADRNCIPLYDFPAQEIVNHYVKEAPVRSSSLRALGAYGNVFAIESFMDELARAAGSDPVAFRLRHLKDPRGRAVIEEAVRRSSWSSFQKVEGRGHGLGFAKYKNLGAYCAVVAEVDASGSELRVRRLVAAVDAGQPVNPDGLANQVEGGCIQATSWTLKEGTREHPGRNPLNWEEYPILKFSEVPAVEVHILKTEFPSVGAGECTMGPTAAAIGNALYDALGVRARHLPLTPENIAKAA